MAAYNLYYYVNGKPVYQASTALTLDFLSVKIGASLMEIKETSGKFDFSAHKLVNIVAGGATGEAVEFDQMNTAIAVETAARTAADSAELTARNAAIAVETTARTAADALLIPLTQRGAANGVATLDGSSKIPVAQLPNSVMEYKGAFNPNTTLLVNGTGLNGDVYRASVAGSRDFGAGAIAFLVGEFAIYNGTIYEHATADVVAQVQIETSARIAAISAEQTARDAAIAVETTARVAAVSAEATARDAAIAVETTARIAAVSAEATARDAAIASALGGANTQSFTNDNAGSITVRQCVYVKSNGHVDLADKTIDLVDSALGIVSDPSISTTVAGLITVKHGAIVSGFSGMTPGKRQFVGANGALTEVPPSASGNCVYKVGRALSATMLSFEPEYMIAVA